MSELCAAYAPRKLPDGRLKALVQGLRRQRSSSSCVTENYLVCRWQIHRTSILQMKFRRQMLWYELCGNLENRCCRKILSPDVLMMMEDVTKPGRLADIIAANPNLKVEESQPSSPEPDRTSRAGAPISYAKSKCFKCRQR